MALTHLLIRVAPAVREARASTAPRVQLVEVRGMGAPGVARIAPFEANSADSLVEGAMPASPSLVAKVKEVVPILATPPPPTRSTDVPVGGCLQSSWRQWQAISHDRWVTDVIRRGYALTFTDQPPLTRPIPLPSYKPGSERALALDDSVRQMIAKGAVELVDPAVFPSPGFYSRLFVVPKPGEGNWRPIIDL